jgi:hypothetical protein
MADYNFKLFHKPGEQHAKPDFLSRHPAYDKGEHNNENTTLLKEYHFREMTVNLETIGEEYCQRIGQGMKNGLEDKLVAVELAKKTKGWRKLPDGVVAVEERNYVPRDEQLRQEIIREHHNDRVVGHPGRYKTQELITRNYWWPMISRDVTSYVDRCEACQRTNVIHEPSHAPLHLHSIPTAPWEKILVDLVGPLPVSNGHDMIMVVMDWLTKAMVAIPTTSTITMDKVARLFQNNVWN